MRNYDLNHDVAAIFAFIEKILQKIKALSPSLYEAHIFQPTVDQQTSRTSTALQICQCL